MRICITGAQGFIGSHLGNKLVELGHEVIGVDNQSHPSENKCNFEVINMNFRHFLRGEMLNSFGAVYHLAADINVDESIVSPEKYLWNNVFETLSFLEEARKMKYQGKIIYASSAEVYGTAQRAVMDEDHPLDPVSPYAVSKLSAEQLCKNYAQLYELKITVIRNFNTFGEYQRGGVYGGVIAKFKEQAINGGPITVYGSGEQMRDYMHISQAVSGYVLVLDHNMPLIVNFGAGKPIKIVDIANYIATKFGVSLVHEKARPNEIMRLEADISRAVKCGYKVETDFWKHLEDYLNFSNSQ